MKDVLIIEKLLDDFTPRQRPRRVRVAMALLLCMLALSVANSFVLGLRADVMGMFDTPTLLVRNFILLLLGTASGWAVIDLARPESGSHGRREFWLILSSAAVPLGIIVQALLTAPVDFMARLLPLHGLQCVTATLLTSTIFSIVLVGWLRRGAPTQLGAAAWLTGVSSGAFGAFTYSWHCPHDDPLYIAVWYSLAVALAALMARCWVKPIIRW
jgi:hypothetical protein